jgi:CheY-like chemotaxis protein
MDGFEVVVSARGQAALELAYQTQPDLFLVDFHLADMQGVELVAQLRHDPRFADAPIVMASGLNVHDEAIKAGATEFLVKPFEPGTLADFFNGLLG